MMEAISPVVFDQGCLRIYNADRTQYVEIHVDNDLTAPRVLTFLTGDQDITATFTGDVTLPEGGGGGLSIGKAIALSFGVVRY